MNYKEIFQELKNKPLARLYLLHGEEDYVRGKALQEMKRRALEDGLPEMNHAIFTGDTPLATLDDAAQALPFLAPKRLVEVRDHPALAAAGGEEEKGEGGAKKSRVDPKPFEAFFAHIPDTTCVVFTVRGTVNPRSALAKRFAEQGTVYEFAALSESETIPYIVRFAKEGGCTIARETASFLYRYCGQGLGALEQEMAKLCAAAPQGEVTQDMIRLMCAQSVEWKVFGLLDAVFAGRADQAMAQLCGMLDDGESPSGILALMERQFRYMALACQGQSPAQLAAQMKVQPFIVEKAARQAQRFSPAGVLTFLQRCRDAGLLFKQGAAQERASLELLVMQCLEASRG
ncbi:MAG: DNA polymerase III subunit delta [Eubacteriales bacterium]|nr:DNA polymerase III subunit delta [Eubacteriales bacterium]